MRQSWQSANGERKDVKRMPDMQNVMLEHIESRVRHLFYKRVAIWNARYPYVPGKNTVAGAMQYATGGGKRLRPLLTCMSYLAFSKEPIDDAVVDFSVAVESVHAYSLVHDDLPCMDNDDFRRGQPTVHKAFGEAPAVLCGDALLTMAFEITSFYVKEAKTAETMRRRALAQHELAQKSGLFGMIGGQVLDLSPETASTPARVRKMAELKTAAMIEASCRIGAILAGATEDELRRITEFATHLAVAFQAKDDLFDVEQDEREGKITLISGMSPDEAQQFVEKESALAVEALKDTAGTEALVALCDKLINRII